MSNNNNGVRGAILIVGSLLIMTLYILFPQTQGPGVFAVPILRISMLLFVFGTVDMLLSIFKSRSKKE